MQFTISFTIVASLASLIGTFATPIESRHNFCTPNFAGIGQSIANNYTGTEWFIASDNLRIRINNNAINEDVANFFVQQNGRVPPAFVIKDNHDPNLLVTANHDEMFLQHEHQGDNNQLFTISCDICKLGDSVPLGTADAIGCQIKNVANGLCATGTDVVGTPVLLKYCDGGRDQIWDFFAGN